MWRIVLVATTFGGTVSTLATTSRTKQKSGGARGMIAVGLSALVAIAVTLVVVAQPGTTHPRTAAFTHHPALDSHALGVSGRSGSGPATASHSALTKVPLYRGTSAAGHQSGAVAPLTRDAAGSAARAVDAHSTVPAQAARRTSYGEVP